MKSTHLFSPEKGRKVTWYGSVAFMVLAWLSLATLWIWIIARAWLQSYFDAWTFGAYLLMSVYLFILIMIPVQLRRYIRERRR
jgi:hypothetical protein